MIPTRTPRAATVSRQLRAAGHTILASSDRYRREGVTVSGSRWHVQIVVDIVGQPSKVARILTDLTGTLEGLGYAVERLEDGLYVTYAPTDEELAAHYGYADGAAYRAAQDEAERIGGERQVPEPQPEPATVLTLQPAEVTDQLADDGTELTRLPYPFHVDSNGDVLRQDFWKGNPTRVIGFAARLDVHAIDLPWQDALGAPQRAVGMYAVTSDSKGGWATHTVAIETVTDHRQAPTPAEPRQAVGAGAIADGIRVAFLGTDLETKVSHLISARDVMGRPDGYEVLVHPDAGHRVGALLLGSFASRREVDVTVSVSTSPDGDESLVRVTWASR